MALCTEKRISIIFCSLLANTQVETEKCMRKVYIKFPQMFVSKSISLLEDIKIADGRENINDDDRYNFIKVSVFFQHLRYLAALTCIDGGASIYTSVWTKWANTLKQ